MRTNPEGRQLIAHLRQLDVELNRQRRLRLSIRAVWVAALLLCIGIAARNWAGLQISTTLLLLITVVALLLGLVYAFSPALGAFSLAQAFDREYALDAQIATALELNATGQIDGLTPLITDHARRRLAFISSDVDARVGAPLRLELQTLALVAVLAAGILLLGGLSSSLPTASPSALSGLPQPADVEPPDLAGAEPAPNPAANEPGGERPASNPSGPTDGDGQELSAEGQQAADALAEALRDNGATRAAADALQQGDTSQAADELRRLADQADQLSPESRSDIASALERAANDLQADQPDLAERLRQDAAQIRGNDPTSGLDDLARAVENLDQAQPQPSVGQTPDSDQGAPAEGAQGDQDNASQPDQTEGGGGGGAGNGASGPGRTSPPPPATGADVPLPPIPEPDGPTTPGQGNGNTTITLPGGEGNGSDASGGLGGSVPSDISDPATIPPELRDAIQNYFGR